MFIQHAAFVLHAESAALSVGSSLLARTSSAAARISESASRACWREGADTLKGGHRTAARISESASRACQALFGVHPLGCLSSLEGREDLTGFFCIQCSVFSVKTSISESPSLLTSTATIPYCCKSFSHPASGRAPRGALRRLGEGTDTLKGGHRTAARISESASRACQALFGVHPLGCLSSLEGREALTGFCIQCSVFSVKTSISESPHVGCCSSLLLQEFFSPG
jgi:hypothetical protein